jgi:hypothetical protein
MSIAVPRIGVEDFPTEEIPAAESLDLRRSLSQDFGVWKGLGLRPTGAYRRTTPKRHN